MPPVRADARRNRAAILRAGEAALVEQGTAVTVNEIVRRAGVSKGTFFRHFESKDELVSALVAEHYTALLALVREDHRAEGSARDRLERYMLRAADSIAAHRAYIESDNQLEAASDEVREVMRKVDSAVGQLLSRAQADGSVRGDVGAADVHAMILVATITATAGHAVRPDLWRRYLELLIEGLDPDRASPLQPSLPGSR